jgi:hypothetical protein
MSTRNPSAKVEVHVRLLDEGTEVCRPTSGLQLEDGVYRLLATADYNPEHERWEFSPGSVVRCRREKWSGVEVLVACELVTESDDV